MSSFRGRIHERNLIVPALHLADSSPNGTISTTDLIKALTDEFQPDGDDAAILEGRHDSKFSQIVRNLVSHRESRTSIFKKGFADYTGDGIKITDSGREFLKNQPE